jgi:hypothetical protein
VTFFDARDSISSKILGEKFLLLTSANPVTILRGEFLFLGDQTQSRYHFEAENALF